jgi:ATP-binding cassette subfamily B protein
LSSNKEKQNVDTDLLKRLYSFVRPYRWYVLLAVMLTLSASFMGTIRPKLTQLAIDEHIANDDFQGLYWIVLLLVGTLISEFILLVGNTYLTLSLLYIPPPP